MSRKQKRQALKGVLVLIVVFLALTLFVPMMTVTPVALGATPTAIQQIHSFFTSVKDWFANNLSLIALMVGLILVSYYFLIKKK